jgi:hypothetical protein
MKKDHNSEIEKIVADNDNGGCILGLIGAGITVFLLYRLIGWRDSGTGVLLFFGIAFLLSIFFAALGRSSLQGDIARIAHAAEHKDCPHCGESIKIAATLCRFCQRPL